MVLRRDRDGVLAVGQPAHAWLCGQLARTWGNARFGAVTPRDEVALGAEQHDVGMAAWDLDPALNPETGLPQSFMEMAPEANAALWRRGPVRLVSQSRYAALLAMMHGRRLYVRHPRARGAQQPAGVDLGLDLAGAAPGLGPDDPGGGPDGRWRYGGRRDGGSWRHRGPI